MFRRLPRPFLRSTTESASAHRSARDTTPPELPAEGPPGNGSSPHREEIRSIRFGEFEIRLESEELLRDGRNVRLPPQAVRVLALLALRRGRVVTREELRQHLWGDAFVDFEQGLNNSIHRIRTALRDDAQEPRFVETLPRRGYRFLPGATFEAENDADRSAAPPRSARPRVLGAVAGLGLLLAGIAWFGQLRSAERRPVVLAIPPVEILDGSGLDESAGDELAEVITSEFVRRAPASYRVLGRASFALASRRHDPRPDALEAARRLGATHILAGALHRESEDRFNLNLQLVQLPGVATIWARTYELKRSRLLGIERRVVSDLGEAFGVDLRIGAPEDDLEDEIANLALQARYRLRTERRADEAVELYRRLVERAPGSAEVQAGYASALYLKGMRTHEFAEREALIPPLRRALRRALELDPSMPAALALSGQVATYIDRDPEAAGPWFDRALRIAPNDARVRLEYSRFLSITGHHDEAIEEMLFAKQADPESSVAYGNLGLAYWWARRWEEMRSACTLALELNRESFSDFSLLLQSLWRLGRYEEARQQLLTYLSDPRFHIPEEGFDELKRAPTDQVQAASLRLLLDRFAPEQSHPDAFAMASTYALLGDMEEAGVWLERAVGEESWSLAVVNIDPDLEPMREDPRYAELFSRSRQPRRWRVDDPGRPL